MGKRKQIFWASRWKQLKDRMRTEEKELRTDGAQCTNTQRHFHIFRTMKDNLVTLDNTGGWFIIMKTFYPLSTTRKLCDFSFSCIYLAMHQYLLCVFNLSNSQQHLHVNDAAAGLRSVSAVHETPTERSKKAAHFSRQTKWNEVKTERRWGLKAALGCQVEGSSPQSSSTENMYMKLSSLRRAFEQVIARYRPTRINKDWKMLNAACMQVGGLWEAIWLWA